ncbi:hypothetical protein J2TS4_10390 [Paenibacillus sp. J2TS4]|nr:hypothetical protein J2TS4_10390 [Paenibacillus sp. J2TS4]
MRLPIAIRFEEALIGHEDLSELEEDDFFGFNVDAGLACICDKRLHQAFCDFVGNGTQKKATFTMIILPPCLPRASGRIPNINVKAAIG